MPPAAHFALPAPYNSTPIRYLKYKSVAAGAYNSAGILNYPNDPSVDGRLVVWGNNQGINGTLVSSAPDPTSLGLLRKFKHVALGHRHGIGIRTGDSTIEGKLVVWTYYDSPPSTNHDPYGNIANQPSGRFMSVMGGYTHCSAVTEYHEAVTWGGNSCSQFPAPSGNNFISVGLGQSSQMTVAQTQGASCYANCDGSTVPPILTVNDFICFGNRFAAGDPYCDCDGVGGLSANDFQCFNNKYAAGCGN